DIYQLEVNPSYIIGKQLYNSNEIEEAELSELEDKKNKIITEMEKQIESAYERNKLKSLSVIELLFLSVTRVMDIYAGMFSFLSGKKTIKNTPVWANEALKIDEWEDVERIEKDV